MDVSESEYNAYYSLDSQRDFEDFCEADIRQTMEPSRSGSSTRYGTASSVEAQWMVESSSASINWLAGSSYIKFHIKITCIMTTFGSLYFVTFPNRSIII